MHFSECSKLIGGVYSTVPVCGWELLSTGIKEGDGKDVPNTN